MKKVVLAAMLVLVVAVGAFAEAPFFPTEKGTVFITGHTKKDSPKAKPKEYVRTTITEVEGSGKDFTVTCRLEALDKKRNVKKNDIPFSYKMNIVDGAVEIDPRNFLTVPISEELGMSITGDTLRIPYNLSPGQKLDDANVTITVDMGVMKSVTEVAISEFKCLALENITVPAGTYEAYKVTQTAAVTAKFGFTIRETANTVEWYVRGIGPVKTIFYNKKGKIKSIQKLYDIKS